jgi:hypothetical protein
MQQNETQKIMDRKIKTEDDINDMVFKMFQSKAQEKPVTPNETVTT